MKKILILGNHAEGLYNFRKQLIQKLITEHFDVHYSVPAHPKVDRLKAIGGIYHEIRMNRRGMNPFEDFRILSHYYSLIKTVNPDVILTYTIKPNVYGGIAAALFKKPVIANITGLGSSFQRNNSIAYLVKKLYTLGLRKANSVFFQNQENLEFFLKNKVIPKSKATLLPGSGVSISDFFPIDNPRKDNTLQFLFIGRIMTDKGIYEFLSAAYDIKKNSKNTSFKIIGDYDEAQYKTDIANMVNEGVVEYLGVLSDVREEISKSDCIVLPSYHEGMSNVLLEGASMGKPLITTRVHGCKEIVEDGKNGFLCAPKDAESLKEAIIKFIKLPNTKRKEMGLRSREKVVHEFNRDIIIDKYLDKIESITNESR